MGISIRAYGRHRGVSDAAVRKAIKSGRIRPESDGTIDADKADAEWHLNTDAAQQRGASGVKPVPEAALDAVRDTLKETGAPTHGGTTYMQARTANEVLKAQTNRVRLQKLKGELIDRAKVMAHVFTLGRQERDAWLTWPARISAQMASDLGADPHTTHVTLEHYVRQHLAELAEFRAGLD
ncbi:MAG: elements of external origin [bacterium]